MRKLAKRSDDTVKTRAITIFFLENIVNTYNWEEDMNIYLDKFSPYRWKVYQFLLLEGENWGEGAKKDF